MYETRFSYSRVQFSSVLILTNHQHSQQQPKEQKKAVMDIRYMEREKMRVVQNSVTLPHSIPYHTYTQSSQLDAYFHNHSVHTGCCVHPSTKIRREQQFYQCSFSHSYSPHSTIVLLLSAYPIHSPYIDQSIVSLLLASRLPVSSPFPVSVCGGSRMPSTNDQPSSSQLLVSRHDASLRPSDHGTAEGLTDEADEPPNINSQPQPHSLTKQQQQVAVAEADNDPDSSGTEGDEDRSDHEEEEVGRAAKLTSPSAAKLRNRSSPTAATAALRLRDASADTTDSSSGDEAASDSGSISPSPSSPPPTHITHTLAPPSHLPTLTAFNTAATGYSLPDNYDPSLPTDVVPPAGVSVSWVNPKLEARTSHTGSGIFALEPIEKDDVLIVWTGRILSAEQTLSIMDTADKHYILQIADGFYQTPLQAGREPADWTNHSCAPNAGFGKASPVALSAMRSIGVGEEVTFDYGMCETDERLWEPMECMCGAEQCRHLITANDWRLHPVLWQRYEGYFSPHVQKCIDAYRAQLAATQQRSAVEEVKPAVHTESEVQGVTQAPSSVVVGGGWFDRVLYALGVVRVTALQQAGVATAAV